MSTLQHINSVVNYNWPELSRKYPGFDKPQIVPASTLRGIAPTYLRSAIDQSEDSYFMFIAGDVTKGDCSRDAACRFFDELFYEKLQMPSSYDIEAGGQLPREQAIDAEVLPPAGDRQFRSFYDEQMARMDAEEERQRRIENLGFDPDDGNTIDAEVTSVDGVPAGGNAADTAVDHAQTTAVGMPKKIFYCVDFHCPAGGMLGYDGNSGRLGGRGGRRFLREAHTDNPVGDIFKAYTWANGKNLCKGMVSIAKASPAPDAAGSNRELHDKYNLFIVKYSDGTFLWIQESADSGSFSIAQPKMDAARAAHWAEIYDVGDMLAATAVELEAYSLFSEAEKSDPEEMMKEFVEKKENGEVEEDEYRRPKNQPHNLHRVDEKDAPAEYHNDFGSDLLACVKGMNDHDFNSTRVGVWGGFGFDAVVPTAFSGDHVTLEPGDGDMLRLPQFLAGLKEIGVKKLSDVKTLDVYGEDSEYAGFKWECDIPMKVISLKFSSKKNAPNPKDEFNDFLSEEDGKNESEELNESMVRFCDRLIRG